MGVNPVLQEGVSAPDFTLPSDTEGDVTLSSLQGHNVILYFYPKDMTPGCTTQACDFTERYDDFEAQGYKVYGVSPDPVERHAQFREKHNLNFPLLSDTDHAVAEAYGVWREKKNYGKTYMGIVRSTFLINKDGVVVRIMDNVRAKGHVEKLLRELE